MNISWVDKQSKTHLSTWGPLLETESAQANTHRQKLNSEAQKLASNKER